MSRTFAEYSNDEKVQILMNSNMSQQSQLSMALEDIETYRSVLSEALELLERANKGKPFKRDYKLLKKYLGIKEI